MRTNDEILIAARQYGQKEQLPYAGAVTPQEAFALLQNDPAIKLIDVRTKAERDWVGVVEIPATQHVAIQWNLYPEGKPNPHFLEELQQAANPQTILLFLCRSGVRSQHAAKLATQHAYINCFNILEGFEGEKDTASHRKTVGGWCKHQLPWVGA